jgi:hypothetical protein
MSAIRCTRCTRCGRLGHALETCATEYKAMRGSDQGGIRTLADILARCYVDDVTGCHRWRGATSASNGKSELPVAWFAAEQRITSVLRIAYMLAHPRADMKGRIVWRHCRSSDCCNPAHLRAGTRKEWGEWVAREDHRKGDPAASGRNRIARVKSGDAILTPELALWARESGQYGIDVAHALGVSPTSVSRARLGRTWAESAPHASIFGRAAQAWLTGDRA